MKVFVSCAKSVFSMTVFFGNKQTYVCHKSIVSGYLYYIGIHSNREFSGLLSFKIPENLVEHLASAIYSLSTIWTIGIVV
jgi:hypothetical protein